MAAYTSVQTGDWNDPATWGEATDFPIAGDTATVANTHVVTLARDEECASWTVNAGGELDLATFEISGMTANCTVNGTLLGGAGCAVLFNSAGLRQIVGSATGRMLLHGTAIARATINNVGASTWRAAAFGEVDVRYCDAIGGHEMFFLSSAATRWRFDNVDFRGAVIAISYSLSVRSLVVRNSWISGCSNSGIRGYNRGNGVVFLENCTFGKRRDGTAAANAHDLRGEGSDILVVRASRLSLQSASQFSGPVWLWADNYGCANGDGTPGAGFIRVAAGIVERAAAAKKSADFGARNTPSDVCDTTSPLDSSIHVPVASGDSIAVSVYARRSGMSEDCAKIILDPAAAFFTADESSEVLTNTATWYELTASGAAASAAGNCRIVLRVDEYEAAAYVDFADMVVTVTHADSSVTTYNVDFSKWANGMPVAVLDQTASNTDPGVANVLAPTAYKIHGADLTGTFDESARNTDPGEANVKDGETYTIQNVSKTGTYDPVTGQYTDPGKANVTVGNDYTFAGVAQVAEFDEAARNDDPGVANVLDGVAYKIQNASLTGTFDEAARNTDPGESNVRDGTAYKIQNADLTGNVTLPPEARVEVDYTYGANGTEFTGTLDAGATPATPTLSVANVGDGASVTATVAGDALVTHTLYYMPAGGAAWTAGESRIGDGDIVQAGLTEGTYYYVALSTLAGVHSAPSALVVARVSDGQVAAGSGPLTEHEDGVIELVARSATFQALIGAAGDEAARVAYARGRIHLDVEEAPERPFAAVMFDLPHDWQGRATHGGDRNYFADQRATLHLLLEADVDDAYATPSAQARAFKLRVDGLIADMMDRAGADGFLDVREISVVHGPQRHGKTDRLAPDDYWQCALALAAGGAE